MTQLRILRERERERERERWYFKEGRKRRIKIIIIK